MGSVITQLAELLWINLGHDGECIEQALCRWWMSSNTHLQHKAHKVKLGFDQLDCPGIFGTLLDRYPELDPQEDEAVAVAEPIPGSSSDPRCNGDNGKTLGVNSHLWREECFCEAEEKLRQRHNCIVNEPGHFGF